MDISTLCNWIIVIGGVVGALTAIYQFFIKATKPFKEKAEKKEEEKIRRVTDPLAAKIEAMHSTVNNLERDMQEIKNVNGAQTEEIRKTVQSVQAIQQKFENTAADFERIQRDSIRLNLIKIYYEYQPYKKILDYEKKAFVELYKDYEELHGNSYVKTIYDEVNTWKVVHSRRELR